MANDEKRWKFWKIGLPGTRDSSTHHYFTKPGNFPCRLAGSSIAMTQPRNLREINLEFQKKTISCNRIILTGTSHSFQEQREHHVLFQGLVRNKFGEHKDAAASKYLFKRLGSPQMIRL